MRSFLALSCVAYLASANQFTTHPIDVSYDLYEQWLQQYDIDYVTADTKLSTYATWKTNVERINEHNSGHHKWSQGINTFTGLTDDEFSASNLMEPQDCSATAHNSRPQPALNPEHPLLADSAKVPEYIDWRDAKIITEVKNQGSCGSCWTFSTTGCLEAHYAQFTGQLTSFAEQQLVDCAGDFNNFGCDGGLPSQAFEYVMSNGGIDTEFVYHYDSGATKVANVNCSATSKEGAFAGAVFGVYNVSQYNETDIYDKVGRVGPVSICYDVVSGFSSYTGGIYSSSVCGNTSDSVNHAVLAVGYGVQHDADGSTPFWIVKNSWGWGWGVDGYFLIERGVNMCGLSSCASFPIVDPDLML